ncbi:hypothetical protein Tco_1102374 [Tanacetum coccineum]
MHLATRLIYYTHESGGIADLMVMMESIPQEELEGLRAMFHNFNTYRNKEMNFLYVGKDGTVLKDKVEIMFLIKLLLHRRSIGQDDIKKALEEPLKENKAEEYQKENQTIYTPFLIAVDIYRGNSHFKEHGRTLYFVKEEYTNGISTHIVAICCNQVVSRVNMNEPSTTALVSTTVPINSQNKNGMEEGNIGTCSTPIEPTLYAKLVTGEPSWKSVNFRTLITSARNRVDVAVSLESIRATSEWFTNTAYGFSLGMAVAYLIVANYVRNTWSKYELVKYMFNPSNGLFFFHFSSKDGLDAMLNNSHCKDDLSAIATKLCTPLMLDSYTSDIWMHNSHSEVEDVINEHAGFMASKGLKSGNDSGYGINSSLEQ